MKGQMTEHRDFRFLIGFMDEEEAIATLRSRGAVGFDSDEQRRQFWKTCHEAVAQTGNPHLKADVKDLPPDFSDLLDEVAKNPVFPEAVLDRSWRFASVEIDKLVCIQKHVDATYAHEASTRAGKLDGIELARFCLTEKTLGREVTGSFDQSLWAFTFASPSIDFRLTGAQGGDDPVAGRKVVSFILGWGVPFVTVVKMDARFYLRNGYHRVHAVRSAGKTHVPCLLIDGKVFEDSGVKGGGFFSQQLLRSQHPPLFADFFSDQIAPPLKLLPFGKVVRLKADEFVVPGDIVSVPADRQTSQPAPAATASVTPGYLGFRILREEWTTYALSDGTTLRCRQTLVNVRTDPSKRRTEQEVGIELSPVLVATIPPRRLLGPPSTTSLSPEQLQSHVADRNLSVRKVTGGVCEYVIDNGVKLVVQQGTFSALRTDQFNANGEPIYLINLQSMVQAVPPNQGATGQS